MKAYEYIPRYTYADYAQWEGNWELISGYPHAMSLSPVRKHQLVYTELTVALHNAIKNSKDCNDCRVIQDLDWIVSDDTVVRPDIMIVCGKFSDDFLKSPPEFIIEILSKATSLKDRHVKYQLYESQGVKVYAIVNPDTRACDIFELINGEYIQNNTLGTFALHDKCSVSFHIAAFIQQLNLD